MGHKGYKSEKIGAFLVIRQEDNRGHIIKTVFLNHISVVKFDINNNKERRLAAIELVDRGLCCKRIAGAICGFHRNTVAKLVRTKELLGLEAALEENRGGNKEPYKYVEKIKSVIKKLQRRHPDWTDQQIANHASKTLNMPVSRSSAARIRTASQSKPDKLPTKSELMKLAKIIDAVDKRQFDSQQIELNFQDPELKQKSEEFAKEGSPSGEKETETRLIEMLKQGIRSSFAGGLMHNLFLQEIDYDSLLAPLPSNKGSTYQSKDILLTLVHSVLQNIPSIEALKMVNSNDLGLLIGLYRTPEKETVRDHLTHIAKLELSSELMDRLARLLLEKGRIDNEVFFIDGHFLPYYGLSVIAKGYHTVRRLVMRGNELYAISDLQGRPLFFITESNEIDFRPIISRAADMLVKWGIERPILVFDRGGYGVHFFNTLNNTADFVTWAKYVGKNSFENIKEGDFFVCLSVNGDQYLVAEQWLEIKESITTASKEGRDKPTCIKVRLIILKDVKTGKKIGIYTNNNTKGASDIAYYMLQRWGDSENFFKEFTARFNINYHPGYDIKELERQPLVDNPDIVTIRKAIKALKQDCHKIAKEIEFAEMKLIIRKGKRVQKKLSGLQQSLEEKEADIKIFEQKLTALPEKISIIEILKGRAMNRCDLEKKKLYDLMQIIAFHSRERLVEIFKDCYYDKSDIKQVLDMITTRSGYVQLTGQTLVVILDWIENKKHRKAANKLCHLLNEKKIKLTGRLNVKLHFHLSCIPYNACISTDADERTIYYEKK